MLLLIRVQELREFIDQLMGVARGLKSRRVRGGALELESVEVQVQLSETKSIENLNPKEVHIVFMSFIIYIILIDVLLSTDFLYSLFTSSDYFAKTSISHNLLKISFILIFHNPFVNPPFLHFKLSDIKLPLEYIYIQQAF